MGVSQRPPYPGRTPARTPPPPPCRSPRVHQRSRGSDAFGTRACVWVCRACCYISGLAYLLHSTRVAMWRFVRVAATQVVEAVRGATPAPTTTRITDGRDDTPDPSDVVPQSEPMVQEEEEEEEEEEEKGGERGVASSPPVRDTVTSPDDTATSVRLLMQKQRALLLQAAALSETGVVQRARASAPVVDALFLVCEQAFIRLVVGLVCVFMDTHRALVLDPATRFASPVTQHIVNVCVLFGAHEYDADCVQPREVSTYAELFKEACDTAIIGSRLAIGDVVCLPRSDMDVVALVVHPDSTLNTLRASIAARLGLMIRTETWSVPLFVVATGKGDACVRLVQALRTSGAAAPYLGACAAWTPGGEPMSTRVVAVGVCTPVSEEAILINRCYTVALEFRTLGTVSGLGVDSTSDPDSDSDSDFDSDSDSDPDSAPPVFSKRPSGDCDRTHTRRSTNNTPPWFADEQVTGLPLYGTACSRVRAQAALTLHSD